MKRKNKNNKLKERSTKQDNFGRGPSKVIVYEKEYVISLLVEVAIFRWF